MRNIRNNLELQVFQAYPNKIATMEIIVQKLVEIGVKKITFFPGEHSQVQTIPIQKQNRLSVIAKEALEQSGGNEMTEISYSSQKIQKIMPETTMKHIVAHQTGGRLNTSGLGKTSVALWI